MQQKQAKQNKTTNNQSNYHGLLHNVRRDVSKKHDEHYAVPLLLSIFYRSWVMFVKWPSTWSRITVVPTWQLLLMLLAATKVRILA